MNSVFDDVRDFHFQSGQPVPMKPQPPALGLELLRDRLDNEEWQEYAEACDEQDMAHIAKEACDLLYVVIGRLITYGIDPQPVWDAVHKSNMQKINCPRDVYGKLMKPKGYKAPDIQEILENQGGPT